MNEIQWHALGFSQLSTAQLYQIIQLRIEVFVVEQTCYYQDLDGKDTLPTTLHLVAMRGDELVAYARILAPGVSYPDFSSIGRVIVSQSARGIKLGDQLMTRAITLTEQCWSNHEVKISAQQHLQGYYQKHGFYTISPMYLEDDIPHVAMCTTKVGAG